MQCGGYKKEFKWRPFEESNLCARSTSKVKKGMYASVRSMSTFSRPGVSLRTTQSLRRRQDQSRIRLRAS